MTTTKKSLADRLDDVMRRIAPKGGATYVFDTAADGRDILRITTDAAIGANEVTAGATKADAIAAMEAKFPAAK